MRLFKAKDVVSKYQMQQILEKVWYQIQTNVLMKNLKFALSKLFFKGPLSKHNVVLNTANLGTPA